MPIRHHLIIFLYGVLLLLQEVVRALARRLRTLVAGRPEEARVEGEGVEKPEALVKT